MYIGVYIYISYPIWLMVFSYSPVSKNSPCHGLGSSPAVHVVQVSHEEPLGVQRFNHLHKKSMKSIGEIWKILED